MFNFFRIPKQQVVRMSSIAAIAVLEPVKVKKEEPKMIIDITITRPAPKKREPKVLPVRVFNTFVKIGYRQYKIYIDLFDGYEYVTIDGIRYEVNRPAFGSGGWLTEL